MQLIQFPVLLSYWRPSQTICCTFQGGIGSKHMGYEGGNYRDADKFITAVMKLNTSLKIKAISVTFFRSVATLAG